MRAHRQRFQDPFCFFLQERLQFCHWLKVFRASNRRLDLNQLLEAETPALHAKNLPFLRMRQKRIVASAARDLAKQVQLSNACGQSEVEAALNGPRVPLKRQLGWSSP